MYGIVDFAGGRISKKINGIVLAFYVQLAGLVALLIFAFILPGTIDPSGLLWGALSGFGSGIAIMFLYTGMGKGKISLVLPVAAVVGAGIPVFIGIFLQGERPPLLAICGVLLVFPSIWLVSGGGRVDGGKWMAGMLDCLIAGLGVAVQYAAIAHAPEHSGVWPLVANRASSIVLVFGYGLMTRTTLHLPTGLIFSAAWIGTVASASLALYMLATRLSMLTIAVVLASLYPVIPSILAICILKERVNRMQTAGLIGSSIAVVLITSKVHIS